MPSKHKKGPARHAGLSVKRVYFKHTKPHPDNPRKHPPKGSPQWESLKQSLLSDYFDPLVINERSNCMVSGHYRRLVLMDEGYTSADMVIVNWDEKTHRARMIAANELLGERDEEKYLALIKEIEAGNIEAELTGLTNEQIQAILMDAQEPQAEGQDTEAKTDEGKRLLKKWKVKAGDVWKIGPHVLKCAPFPSASDMRLFFLKKKINLCVTSPPYAEQREYDRSSGFKAIAPDKYNDWFMEGAEAIRPCLEDDGSFFVNIKEHTEEGQRHPYVKQLVLKMIESKWCWIDEFAWIKQGVPGLWPNRFKNRWEPIFHFARQIQIKIRPEQAAHPSELSFDYQAANNATETPAGFSKKAPTQEYKTGFAHPGNVLDEPAEFRLSQATALAPFPLAIPNFFIRAFTDEGDIVFDPFSGTGTTMLAADQLRRVFRGFEISPQTVAVSLERMAEATGQKGKKL